MIVLSIQNAPPKLRGYLTRYFWQISAGIYVGNFSAKVRENVWQRVCDLAWGETRAVMVYSANTEQGFRIDILHDTWQPVDYDGMQLMLKPFEPNIQMHQVAEEYVVLDLETTGFDPKTDKIIEIGALLVKNGTIVQEHDLIIEETISREIEELTGITQLDADGGIPIKDALSKMSYIINGRDVIGYNIQTFDYLFIL